MEIRDIINDIIGFIESLIEQVKAFLASVVEKPGYENPDNYPENFQPTTEAAE